VEQAKSYMRYSLVRSLDNSEAVAETLAEFVKFGRSYGTINNYYRQQAALTPADLQAAARKYFTDNNLIVTTLSKEAMPAAIATSPSLASFSAPAAGPALSGAEGSSSDVRVIEQKGVIPQIELKLLFNAGSANDPAGKEGLAALAASMITDAGSQQMKVDEIRKALYPIAGG